MNSSKKFSRFGLAIFALSLGALAGCGTKAGKADVSDALPCSDPATSSPDVVFGSRLRPYVLAANDGTTSITRGAWFDSKLGVPCVFMRHSETSETVCLPDAVQIVPAMFADEACTKPMTIVEACAETPKFARENSYSACYPPGVSAIRHVLEKLPIGATPYLLKDNVCSKQDPIDDVHVGVLLGEPLAWSEFVAASQSPMQPQE